MNLPDIAPPAELISLASQTPTQRSKDGTESRLHELMASHRNLVATQIVELRASMAQCLAITEAEVGWTETAISQLISTVDELEQRVGLNDPNQLKSWDATDAIIKENEVIKAKIGRLWNKAEVVYSSCKFLIDTLEAWLRRANLYEKDYEATADANFYLFREKSYLTEVDCFRKRCMRVHQQIEQTLYVLGQLSNRKFNATRYLNDMPKVDTEGFETVEKAL